MTDEVSKEEELFEGEEHEISTEVEQSIETEKPVENEIDTEGEKPVETEVETESEPPADKEPTSVPIAALKDERQKRQQLEDEVNNLRKQLPTNDEAPDPYEDIDVYNTYMRNQWQQEQNVAQEQQRNARINESRSKMLETHADYDEMEQIFQLMTVSDKTLVDQMFASGNEAKFAYDTAKAHKASLLAPATEVVTETEKPDTSITEMPNLATATAQAKNTQALEKEADIEDVFADVSYQLNKGM